MRLSVRFRVMRPKYRQPNELKFSLRFFLNPLMGGRARVWLMLCSPQWIVYLSTRFLPAVSSGAKCSRNTTNVAHTSYTTIHAKVKEFWEVAKEETVRSWGRFALTFDKWTGEQEIPEVLPHSERALFKNRLYNPRDDQGLEHSEGRHFAQISHASIGRFQVYLERYHGHNH